MIITAEKGRGNKAHIMLDGEYLLTVDTEFWLSGSIHSGDDIDEIQLEEFKKSAFYRRAYNKAIDLISRCEHSRKALTDKLCRSCCDRETADRVADRLEEIGLLNDRRYAGLLLREMSEYRKMGLIRIKAEMQKRGLPSDIIAQTLENFEDSPAEKIKELIQRKYSNKLYDEKDRRRTVAALMRMGFKYSDIKEGISLFDIDIDNAYD